MGCLDLGQGAIPAGSLWFLWYLVAMGFHCTDLALLPQRGPALSKRKAWAIPDFSEVVWCPVGTSLCEEFFVNFSQKDLGVTIWDVPIHSAKLLSWCSNPSLFPILNTLLSNGEQAGWGGEAGRSCRSWLVTCFHGINSPAIINLKLPTWHQAAH